MDKNSTKHSCKICSREFGSGKALGGHMRAHVMKQIGVKRVSSETLLTDKFFFHSPVLSDDDNNGSKMDGWDLSFSNEKSESESESDSDDEVEDAIWYRRSKKVKPSNDGSDKIDGIRTSYKRRVLARSCSGVKKSMGKEKRAGPSNDEYSPPSSVTDVATTEEENIAQCLIMLSRDSWTGREISINQITVKKQTNNSDTKKYKCVQCDKEFDSYQALGGHRSSHNKIKMNVVVPSPLSPPPPPLAAATIHGCSFCHKVFPSGKALGGHKRSHYIGGNPTLVGPSIPVLKDPEPKSGAILDVDLNLPAPMEDDDSPVSAMSD